MPSKGSRTLLLTLTLSFSLLLLIGLTYFIYLQFLFPQLVPHYGSGERFTLSKTMNDTYTLQMPWSAYTTLHLTLQANDTVELFVNGTYVCDCTQYDFVIEEGGRALIYLRSDFPVSGMFRAWQETPFERQLLASALLLVGVIGVGVSIGIRRKKTANLK